MSKKTQSKSHKKYINIVNSILITVGSIVIDVLPIIITVIIAQICQMDSSTLISDEFVMSGNLIWLGCAYMGFMFIGIFSIKKTMDQGWNILLILNVIGIVIGIFVYLLNKLACFELLKNVSNDVMSTTVYISFGLLSGIYIAYKTISIVCDIKMIRQEEQCQV